MSLMHAAPLHRPSILTIPAPLPEPVICPHCYRSHREPQAWCTNPQIAELACRCCARMIVGGDAFIASALAWCERIRRVPVICGTCGTGTTQPVDFVRMDGLLLRYCVRCTSPGERETLHYKNGLRLRNLNWGEPETHNPDFPAPYVPPGYPGHEPLKPYLA